MIAFGPARTFETDCLERQEGNRNEKNQEPPAEESEYGDIATDGNCVADRRMAGISFGFDAQIIMSRWDAGHDHFILVAAFGPFAITVGAGVVADFTAEVPGAARVLIDERVIEVDPVVRDVGFGQNFNVGLAAFQFEDVW